MTLMLRLAGTRLWLPCKGLRSGVWSRLPPSSAKRRHCRSSFRSIPNVTGQALLLVYARSKALFFFQVVAEPAFLKLVPFGW